MKASKKQGFEKDPGHYGLDIYFSSYFKFHCGIFFFLHLFFFIALSAQVPNE